MCLALNMAQKAKGGFPRATIKNTQQLINQPRAEFRDEKKRGGEHPGHKRVKAAIERYRAMVYKNHTDGSFACQNGTGQNPESLQRRKEPSVSPLKPAAPSPGMPPAPPSDTEAMESDETEGMPSRCVYIHSPLPNTQFFNPNAHTKDSKRNKDFSADLLNTLSTR